MQRDDAQLIRSILAGNDEAFSTLVHKYKKGVHALAWRKIGDFHHAEEITQDTFLQAYKKLSTLNNPNQFAGVALCDCKSAVPELDAQEKASRPIAGGHIRGRHR